MQAACDIYHNNSFTVNLEVTEGNQENDIVKELEILKGTMR